MTDIDITFVIYSASADKNNNVGFESIYTQQRHPATAKTLEGTKWGESYWPKDFIENSSDFYGATYDATTSGINTRYILNGIGDNDDLLVEDIVQHTASGIEYNVSGIEYWTPTLNHGYYYINNEEWYLHADSYQAEVFRHNIIYSGLQYLELTEDPKPANPITVKQYEWDNNNLRYKPIKTFRKKVNFSGTLISGEELETVNDDDLFILENIDFSNPEFTISGEIDDAPLRIYLNGNYTSWVGDNTYYSGMEVVFSGEDAGVHHLSYAPVDTTSGMNVWVDSGIYLPEEWTQIDFDTTFSGPEAKEYKVDEVNGLVIFGDGIFGMRPLEGWEVRAAYCRTSLAEYEVKGTEDKIEFQSINLNPLYNNEYNGILFIKT